MKIEDAARGIEQVNEGRANQSISVDTGNAIWACVACGALAGASCALAYFAFYTASKPRWSRCYCFNTSWNWRLQMPGDSDVIIINGYKQKVKYYDIGPLPAWTITVVPFVVGLVLGALCFWRTNPPSHGCSASS